MNHETDGWRRYYEPFAARLARIPADALDRNALVAAAAHDVYQSTTDDLTRDGWDAERALMAGRLFNTVVKDWLESGRGDTAALEHELRERYGAWTD